MKGKKMWQFWMILNIVFVSQQVAQGVTHLLNKKKGKKIKRSDLNLNLSIENGDCNLFPTIGNKRRQMIIQKYNGYVYILQKQRNGKLSIVSDPIDCGDSSNYESLTDDGEYLTVWNFGTKEFRVYNIKYE